MRRERQHFGQHGVCRYEHVRLKQQNLACRGVVYLVEWEEKRDVIRRVSEDRRQLVRILLGSSVQVVLKITRGVRRNLLQFLRRDLVANLDDALRQRELALLLGASRSWR